MEEFDAGEFFERLMALEEHMEGAAGQALLEAGEMILGDAQQLCPVEWGTLQGSASLDDSAALGPEPEVVFGFNTDYAAAVHERLDVHHDVGQARFLATAIEQGLPRVLETLGREIEEEGLR